MKYKGILYTIDNILCITSTLEIEEVIQGEIPSPLPLSKEWLLGVIQLRGHIIPVTDLRLFSSAKNTHYGRDHDKNNILIVEHDHWQYGFKVTKLLGIRDLDTEKLDLQDIPNELSGLKEIIDGVYETSEGYIYEIHLKELMNNPSFMNPQVQ